MADSEAGTPGKKKQSRPRRPQGEGAISVIAKPMAGKKLTKRGLKLVKKTSKARKLKRGVKEVMKALRRKEKGLCLLAGDISPIDVFSPQKVVWCKGDHITVNSKDELGGAGLSKRPTCVVLVPEGMKKEQEELYGEVETEARSIAPAW